MAAFNDRRGKGRVYEFQPVGIDRWNAHAGTPETGAHVRKVQPYGTPRNGTMNHSFVENADTGKFHGLVHNNSLVPVNRKKAAPESLIPKGLKVTGVGAGLKGYRQRSSSG